MLQPKLRRALTSAVLMSILSLSSVQGAIAQPRFREDSATTRLESRPFSLWDALASLLRKVSARIDPNGEKTSARIDPNGDH
jgi:hypothetical protein